MSALLKAIGLLVTSMALASACASSVPSDCGAPPRPRAAGADARSGVNINLADALAAGRVRVVNRQAAPISGGTGVRVTAASGVGLFWIKDTDFGEGTLEVDVCGRDLDAQSFVGVAFHGVDDRTYEAVYLRPFNFRSRSAESRGHSVQYIAEPDYGYSRLRQQFPNQFEHSVEPSIAPTAWIPMRVVIRDSRVRVFVGSGDTPALDARQLRAGAGGQVGLFVDNGSDGAFANLRVTHGF